jgi:hypothetical protein
MREPGAPNGRREKVLSEEERRRFDVLRQAFWIAHSPYEHARLKREMAELLRWPYMPPSPEGRTEDELYFDDLNEVGPNKPMGYLGVDPEDGTMCGYDLVQVIQYFQRKDLVTKIFPKTDINSLDALFVYDPVSLQQLLDEHRDTLIASGWPLRASEFVDGVMHHSFPSRRGSPMHKLISRAFLDFSNMEV